METTDPTDTEPHSVTHEVLHYSDRIFYNKKGL